MSRKEENQRIREEAEAKAAAEHKKMMDEDNLPNRDKGRSLVRRKAENMVDAAAARSHTTTQDRQNEKQEDDFEPGEAGIRSGAQVFIDAVTGPFRRALGISKTKKRTPAEIYEEEAQIAEAHLFELIERSSRAKMKVTSTSEDTKPDVLQMLGLVVQREFTESAATADKKKHNVSEGDTKAGLVEDEEIEGQPFTLLDENAKWDLPQDLLYGTDHGTFFPHIKLLILVSMYARPDGPKETRSKWVRELALSVMIYEGCMSGMFDYDYAPKSKFIGCSGRVSRRIWMNISQDGVDALAALVDMGLLSVLKVKAEDSTSSPCYRLSHKGVQAIRYLPVEMKEEVGRLVCPPKPWDYQPLEPSFDGDKFILSTPQGYCRPSTVTDVEDISYVCSPFMPDCLRGSNTKKMSSNVHRAHEAALGTTDIQDDLTEIVLVSKVTLLMAEWVPFGCNNMVSLNERLGAGTMFQGGMFSSVVDRAPTDCFIKCDYGVTDLRVLDYDMFGHINFEANCYIQESKGIHQVESFGVHIAHEGTLLVGAEVDAILDRLQDNISLDYLARFLVDAVQDTSAIVADMLSADQRSMLNMSWGGDELNRSKFVAFFCREIDPRMPAASYLDGADNENELRQLIGDVFAAYDLSMEDILVVGRDGILVAGPQAEHLHPAALEHISLSAREVFVRALYQRIVQLQANLIELQKVAEDFSTSAEVEFMRTRLNELSQDVVLLKDVITYFKLSLDNLAFRFSGKLDTWTPHSAQQASERMYQALSQRDLKAELTMRVGDLKLMVDGIQRKLSGLGLVMQVHANREVEDMLSTLNGKMREVADLNEKNTRSVVSLQLMQVLAAAQTAFIVIDRVSGTSWSMTTPQWLVPLVEIFIESPMAWFLINLLFMAFVVRTVLNLARAMLRNLSGFTTVKVLLRKRMDVAAFETFLSTKQIENISSSVTETKMIKNVVWNETGNLLKWKGIAAPRIEVEYEHANGTMHWIAVGINSRFSGLSEQELVKLALADLAQSSVLNEL